MYLFRQNQVETDNQQLVVVYNLPQELSAQGTVDEVLLSPDLPSFTPDVSTSTSLWSRAYYLGSKLGCFGSILLILGYVCR